VRRPATFFAGNAGESWNTVALLLPRKALVSHLGFEPRGGLHRRNGTVVGRLLLDLIRNAGEEEAPLSRAECYVRLAVHDLVGALFAPSDPAPARHSDKVFMRVRGVIKDGFADPDLDPLEVAARAGISLRYLQKLFTERGSMCSEFIYSFRLDYAAHLLQRQSALGTSQALREIAHASGFRYYSHFARRFRQRFGHAPGAHFAGESCDHEGAFNACG
jgi:AraC family transcriptional activator of tynA and feaB